MATSDDIARVIAKLEAAPGRLKRGLLLEATGRIVDRTPVDTGRARGNWQASSGQPVEGVLDRLDPGGTVAVQAAAQVRAVDGEDLYLVNNLPYIKRLEDGWSQQAPQGMVALTVAELQPLADQIADRIAQERTTAEQFGREPARSTVIL